MALDERARHQLYLRLEEHLGPEAATTLMEYLPPVGWADVATKRDLDHLREVTQADIDLLGQQIRLEMRDSSLALQRKLASQTWALFAAMFVAAFGAVLASAGLH